MSVNPPAMTIAPYSLPFRRRLSSPTNVICRAGRDRTAGTLMRPVARLAGFLENRARSRRAAADDLHPVGSGGSPPGTPLPVTTRQVALLRAGGGRLDTVTWKRVGDQSARSSATAACGVSCGRKAERVGRHFVAGTHADVQEKAECERRGQQARAPWLIRGSVMPVTGMSRRSCPR